MNATTQTSGASARPDPRPRSDVSVDHLPLELAATSPQDIYECLAALQSEFGAFGKDSAGYGYNYVSLGGILDQLRPRLRELNCIVLHSTEMFWGDGVVNTVIKTRLIHVPSKTEEAVQFPCPWAEMKGMSNPQTTGAMETYGRRYNILKLLNCSVQDDDSPDLYRAAIAAIDVCDTKAKCRSALKRYSSLRTQSLETWEELKKYAMEKSAELPEGDNDA